MKYLLICGLLLSPIICNAASSLFVAPIGPPGNGDNIYPFLLPRGVTTMRYQQAFAASSFSQLPGGGTITKLWLTAGGVWGCCWDATIHGMQINLSTTTHAVDSLSAVFAQNVGVDDAVVFPSGGLNFRGTIDLPQPFLYDPSKGNLLLDVRINSGADAFTTQDPLDAQENTGDPISRAYALNVAATAADRVDTLGILMAFTITPVPEPSSVWLLGAVLLGISVRLWRTNSKNKPKQLQ